MKIEHLAYFIEMRNTATLSEAAARAHISQQGYGKVISSLEKSLGFKLVERDTHGARLTEQGKLFLRHAETIVAEYELALTNLRAQHDDLDVLGAFTGKVAFSNVCFATFESVFSSYDLLRQASKRELPLNEVLALTNDPDWLCICDISPQVYPDYAERWAIEPIAVGRVGLIAAQKMLDGFAFSRVTDIAARIPIGLFDCYAAREIYDSIFGSGEFGHVKMRTTNDTLLKEGLMRSDFAILADSFHWQDYHPSLKTGSNPLVFMPFEKEMVSFFGFARKKGLPYNEEQRAVVDAARRTFEHIRPSAAWS